MADGTNIYEPIDGDEVETTIDSVEVDFGLQGLRDRQRVALAGTAANSDVRVRNTVPAPTDNGLVVRTTPDSTIGVTNLPAMYPLPSAQVSDLKNVVVANFPEFPEFPAFPAAFDVSNLPTAYALPAEQLAALTPQKNALTKEELGSTPVWVQTNATDPLDVHLIFDAEGTHVDSLHPLPVAGKFSDENGVPYNALNPLPVDVGGSINLENLTVNFASVVSMGNSLQTPLAADEIFVGPWEEVRDYAAITASVFTDANSAQGGVRAQYSADGFEVISQGVTTIIGGFGAYFAIAPQARYFRIWYQNGPVAQTVLRSEVTFRFNAPTTTQQPVAASVIDTTVAGLNRSVISGRHFTGSYVPLTSDEVGALSVNVNKSPVQQVTNAPDTSLSVSDIYTEVEFLDDVPGDNAVVTLTFSAPRNLIYVLSRGDKVSRVGIGQTPSATRGIYCDDGVPNAIPVRATSLNVYVPSGTTVTVWGLS